MSLIDRERAVKFGLPFLNISEHPLSESLLGFPEGLIDGLMEETSFVRGDLIDGEPHAVLDSCDLDDQGSSSSALHSVAIAPK